MTPTPALARTARRALLACALLVVGATILGAAAAAEVAIHYTSRPKES